MTPQTYLGMAMIVGGVGLYNRTSASDLRLRRKRDATPPDEYVDATSSSSGKASGSSSGGGGGGGGGGGSVV